MSDNDHQQVSFVNSICTLRGGTHVDHVSKKITDVLIPFIEKKNKGAGKISEAIKPQFIKANMFVFVNSLINNPEFDGQTKETLKSKVSNFGSKLDLPEDFIKKSIIII
jgi:DNA topoisomerase-2